LDQDGSGSREGEIYGEREEMLANDISQKPEQFLTELYNSQTGLHEQQLFTKKKKKKKERVCYLLNETSLNHLTTRGDGCV
jgi:3-dehydroquinate dehydratase